MLYQVAYLDEVVSIIANMMATSVATRSSGLLENIEVIEKLVKSCPPAKPCCDGAVALCPFDVKHRLYKCGVRRG